MKCTVAALVVTCLVPMTAAHEMVLTGEQHATSSDDASPATSHWSVAEAPYLTDHVQLTFADRFVKAGEAYFSPDARWIVFQAIERPADGREADRFYAMYTAPLRFDKTGRLIGLGEPIQLSPADSENTCGYFDPARPGRIIFGSTVIAPGSDEAPGYQREKKDYRWRFAPEMRVVAADVPEVRGEAHDRRVGEAADADTLQVIIDGPEYIAECAFSTDGRYIVHTRLVDGQGDLFIHDTKTGVNTPVVEAPGYDGGPFFSPDGRFICYRSDRRNDNLLQVFVKAISYDEDGTPVPGAEYALTADEHVNWCPFWRPDGRELVYATSEVGHYNYEVFGISFDPDDPTAESSRRRITYAQGFDGLPVFSPDGRYMMWTSQRGEDGSSQLWVARAHEDPMDTP
jgi:TolB protein